MSWRVAQALETLLAEVNAEAPHRSKISDGSIGDPAHSSRLSDHNPNAAGVVRARDITHDPDEGVDGNLLADHIRALGLRGHPALGANAYVIWRSRIASATDDGRPWDWEPYSGSNPHDKHVHVSVTTDPAGYDSTAPWLKEIDEMARYEDQLDAIQALATEARDAAKAAKARVDKMGTNLKADRANDKALAKALREVGVDVDKVLARVKELDAEEA